MRKLNEVLKTIPPTCVELKPLQHMPQPGLTSSDGQFTTALWTKEEIGNYSTALLPRSTEGILPQEQGILERKSSQSVTQKESGNQQGEGQFWITVALEKSPKAQDELTRLLYQTYASQRTYGDKAEMMEYRDGMFQMVLADYTFEQIKQAFIQHIKRSPELPTPSDIIKIIDPPPEPLSVAVYTALKKRIQDEGYFPYSTEVNFMRAFEKQEMDKVRRA